MVGTKRICIDMQQCASVSSSYSHTVRQLRIESSNEDNPTVFTELVNSGTQYHIHACVVTVQLYESGC